VGRGKHRQSQLLAQGVAVDGQVVIPHESARTRTTYLGHVGLSRPATSSLVVGRRESPWAQSTTTTSHVAVTSIPVDRLRVHPWRSPRLAADSHKVCDPVPDYLSVRVSGLVDELDPTCTTLRRRMSPSGAPACFAHGFPRGGAGTGPLQSMGRRLGSPADDCPDVGCGFRCDRGRIKGPCVSVDRTFPWIRRPTVLQSVWQQAQLVRKYP
jgi:hypothetical protein